MAVFKDLVVVIPGVLGSRLIRREGGTSRTVWDLSLRGLAGSLESLLTGDLALSQTDEPPDDGVEATELLTFQLLPGLIGVDDYSQLILALKSVAPDPLQLLAFPYDWRGSNRHAAERLSSRALDALNRWKIFSGSDDAKLWLVCHSMGGLVARYFCEHLDGARHTRAVVTFGTPHRGAAKALNVLANGLRYGPLNLSHVVRSLPAVYELLPIYPLIRVDDGSEALQMHRVADFYALDGLTGADLAARMNLPTLNGIDRTMLRRALQFHAAIRLPAEARYRVGVPAPYEQRVFFNRRQPTMSSARLVGSTLTMQDSYPESSAHGVFERNHFGDGTVPAFSAMPIEWDDSVNAVALTERHGAIQCAQAGRETLLNWMQPVAVGGKKGFYQNESLAVSLTSPPAVAVGSPFTLTLAAPLRTALTLSIEPVDGGNRKKKSLVLEAGNVPQHFEFRLNSPGAWRVSALPDDRLRPEICEWVYAFDP
jgi:pimeloyl-ACP methyl ester carboxylesterase